MASQTGKWREDQILVICPGSQTTMAQLGCGELTPPAYRIPTRMFKDEETGGWRPYHTEKRKKQRPSNGVAEINGAQDAKKADGGDDEWEYIEDQDSSEGAVYPLQAGHITNMEAFLAFLDHVHGMLTNTYHSTPIMLMTSPQWTRHDCEAVAQYIFEKTKTPALCMIHSGIATQYGFKWPHLTVIDVGFEKVDVTCIYDSRVVNHKSVGWSSDEKKAISGGEALTQKLLGLLKDKGFSYEMAEKLKKSPICEVLPYTPDSPNLMDLPTEAAGVLGPSQAASGSAEGPKTAELSQLSGPAGDDDDEDDKGVDEDGVLDVANIVASGQTREFLAKKERERAEKAKLGKRAREKEAADAAAAKPTRLPNSKRTRNLFHYEEIVEEDVPPKPAPPAEKEAGPKDVEMADAAGQQPAPDQTKESEGDVQKTEANGEQPQPSEAMVSKPEETPASDPTAAPAPPAAAAAPAPEPPVPERQNRRVRRDIEVGLERFLFADRVEIDRIVTAIYRAVQGIEDMYMRPACWENLVFVGNGARLRGLRDNILQTLNARHLVSPSSATMFTSELPSNLGTPSGTGSQTPTSQFATGALPHQLPTTSSVNPLLQAATTAGLAVPAPAGGAPGSNAGDAGAMTSHHFHSQTPTAIKLAQLPTYLTEWAKHGFEESMFLGAQVAARLAFCIHNMDAQGQESQRLMSLNRVDYNELGPKGIRNHSMLG